MEAALCQHSPPSRLLDESVFFEMVFDPSAGSKHSHSRSLSYSYVHANPLFVCYGQNSQVRFENRTEIKGTPTGKGPNLFSLVLTLCLSLLVQNCRLDSTPWKRRRVAQLIQGSLLSVPLDVRPFHPIVLGI